ncbi:hypothetical protein C2R22_13090 [Salinigranum rubrum]|uniref:Malate dehydrogenase n=1 Tax=Salinigranum rubrum TaxID=755307 RepID=A0A2I8VKL6_9EURY|nr:hypothetical protein C2R22_13090 [Salinigranum rubrum]
MTQSATLRFEPEALEQFAEDVLAGAGLTAPHREIVAKALVRADLRGVDSHGVARLEPYVKHLEAGGYNPDPDIVLSERSPSALVVDADHGPGQSAGQRPCDDSSNWRRSRESRWASSSTVITSGPPPTTPRWQPNTTASGSR